MKKLDYWLLEIWTSDADLVEMYYSTMGEAKNAADQLAPGIIWQDQVERQGTVEDAWEVQVDCVINGIKCDLLSIQRIILDSPDDALGYIEKKLTQVQPA